MVLKGVNWVQNDKIGPNGLERSHLGTQCKNQVICLERSHLGTQCKNQVIWSWKESFGYTMIKLGPMVLKGVSWVHNDKFRSNGLESSQWGHNAKIRSNGLERNQFGYTMKKSG